MATYRNLRYCEVLHNGTYYDVMIGVNDLDEVNNILQEWALATLGESISLPEALTKNQDITEVLTTKDIDNFVYVESAVSSYMDFPRFAGLSGTFPTLPKVLVTSKYVIPESSAFLYSTATFSGIFGEYEIASAEFTLVENEANFIGIDYNSGSPVYVLYPDASSFNYSSIIPVCIVLYFDSEINVIPFGQAGYGLPEKLLEIQKKRKEFDIVSNFTLNNSGLYVELGSLTVSNGTTEIDCLAMDTETTDNDMWLYYRDAFNVWQKIQVTQIDNLQYQTTSSGLSNLSVGEFVVNYIYRVIDDTNLLIFSVLSNKFTSLSDAKESENITNLPDVIKESAVLVGRLIVERSSSSPTVQKIQKVSWGTV